MHLKKLRFRQIHLDFHTSPHIERIGAAFDKRKWQDTLQAAHVDSITCFSKCHHGLSYHPTKVGTMHPHLKFDLLRAQVDACREIDVKVPVYLSAGLDQIITHQQPGWREITTTGAYFGNMGSPLNPGFHKMCFNSPYLDYLCRQIEEAVELFPEADGIFLDIIFQHQCCCPYCMEGMEEKGLDATKEADRKQFAVQVLDKYFQKTTAAAKSRDAKMPIFHNSGHITRGRRDQVEYQSHLELESLPTGGWGYDHFPESAGYVTLLGRDYLGMTGKFHESWGEFGGFKHPNALLYECAAMLAFGAKCSIGDQLHPDGALDLSTYEAITPAYEHVKESEPWCAESESVFDIAVLSSEAERGRDFAPFAPDTGASRILLEGHHLFALVDREANFAKFKLLILPDDIEIDASLQEKVESYVAQGGKLLLTGRSGLKKNGHGFAFEIGANYFGPSPFEHDYMAPSDPYRADFVRTPLLSYGQSERIKVNLGESLGDVVDPYFNRTYRHFCSHAHAPNRPAPSGFDCGVRHGAIIYLAHPIFTIYRRHGAVAHKQYVLKVIRALLGDETTVKTNVPSMVRLTVRRQSKMNRLIVHVLHAERSTRGGALFAPKDSTKGINVEVIDEITPLRDVRLSIRSSKPIIRVTLEPQGKLISFREENGRTVIELDSMLCHQMVVLHEAK